MILAKSGRYAQFSCFLAFQTESEDSSRWHSHPLSEWVNDLTKKKTMTMTNSSIYISDGGAQCILLIWHQFMSISNYHTACIIQNHLTSFRSHPTTSLTLVVELIVEHQSYCGFLLLLLSVFFSFSFIFSENFLLNFSRETRLTKIREGVKKHSTNSSDRQSALGQVETEAHFIGNRASQRISTHFAPYLLLKCSFNRKWQQNKWKHLCILKQKDI